ncbi:MAG: hypothetical protein ACI9Y1_001083 [Lentisphaeria bacterium]|jgi:hypothetical protein
MSNEQIFIGKNGIVESGARAIGGQYVVIGNETFYKISNYDQMGPFFISVVSDSDHWMFISSNGGLTAGRKDADNALFPYYTDDKVTDSAETTGSKTLILVRASDKTSLWEPFCNKYEGIYAIERNIYKNVCGDKLVFEEINHDLGVTFQYSWMTSDEFGFVKTSKITNRNAADICIEVLDGIQNILPYGIDMTIQQEQSCLVDAYKKNELQSEFGLGIYSMSSILVDRAEPSEALSATTVWSEGLDNSKKLISSQQLDNFRKGLPLNEETDVRGLRGAYFVNAKFNLAAQQEKEWNIVAEINQGPAKVNNLIAYLKADNALRDELNADIASGTDNLMRIVGNADGIQVTEDVLSSNHHFANVLFNVMRGGLFDDNYMVGKADLIEFVKDINSDVYEQFQDFFNTLPETNHYSDLISAAEQQNDSNLERVCYEYLPLTFSRRHGDPSRPWNKFSIELKNEDGSKLLNFQGNWRDIFQNWEGLSFSIPNFIESMICKFVNASTADGYNPYRITKQGIDWETLDPEDVWSNIGYWGDHQIIYLLKLLEFSKAHHPGKLKDFLSKEIFCYANIPYSLKSYQDLLQDPHNTIDYDNNREQLISDRVERVGADGKMVWSKAEGVLHVNLTEKLLATVLSKLSNFIPEGGIWMNTQRPEWNDANNALVGYGVSMVTLYYTRRYQQYMVNLFKSVDTHEFAVSEEIAGLFYSINATFKANKALLSGKINDADRKGILDQLGEAAGRFRRDIYSNEFSGKKATVNTSDLVSFCELSLEYIDHTIRANKRDDGLYHAYNLMTAKADGVEINYLYEMLEGQVSVLSSGYLSPTESIEVLTALKQSSIYTERQNSYLLYPDRQLTRFVDKNIIPSELAQKSELITRLLADGNTALVEVDTSGGIHFNGKFNNVVSVNETLLTLKNEGYSELVEKESAYISETFEKIFNHKAFTGRSGGMYAYEGLGSIYWHMVSKLLLATQENYQNALKLGESEEVLGKLVEIYYDIREGIGFNKSPEVYGAFPTDPYSHTPGFGGAKQPGMTGQVKEEVISRLIEMGVVVDEGKIYFNPIILKKSEFLSADSALTYYDINGKKQVVELAAGQLAFTYCQIPVVYSLAKDTNITLTIKDGSQVALSNSYIDEDTAMSIFDKRGDIVKMEVSLKPHLD